MDQQTEQQKQQAQQGDVVEELSIFLNDFTDSDNDAAGLAWTSSLERHPERQGIYIAEPRHVNLGYYMTSADFGRCIGLVARLKPGLDEPPLTTVLAGRMTEEIIDSHRLVDRALNDEEKELLKRCIKPRNGSKEDALTHARLLALDYLSTLRTQCSRPFVTYVDGVAWDHLESPINLKTHYHEELVFRTAEELNSFRTITEKPVDTESQIEGRRNDLRKWYEKAIERKLKDFGSESPLKNLESYDVLFDEMDKYERIVFFGGCSLTILQHILEKRPELAHKIHYFQQGGTFKSELNILGNPLNFALNTKAAQFVFHENQIGKLANFTLIPTDTTKKLEFTTIGLKEWSPYIGLHTLCFYGRMDPLVLISDEEKQETSASTENLVAWRAEKVHNTDYADPNFKGYKAVMADLVAFLISFTDAFDDRKTPQGIVRKSNIGVKIALRKSSQGSDQMILEHDENSPIRALMLDISSGSSVALIEDTRSLIANARESG
ncbi:hypothetical protein BD289DRAFT_501132 [Coniella lustricola]|uniref:Uncharacterized protein n=1 Tax=Coniella lustricola TaxID=2025994 RepID=A0A2T3AJX4_9PEZI|nr:hypothetical protein BD289DRAFT_501132 [Coniella lustricola]